MEKDREILYEEEVSDLKSVDKGRRIFRTIAIFVLEIIFILGMALALGILVSAIIFLIAVVLVIPAPILITPSHYRVMKHGIDCDGRKMMPIKKDYRSSMNERRKYVSILHKRRGEIIRLYAKDPSKLLGIFRSNILK